ncbi:hypothetical protein [Gynuella sp.]|uniref:hypothetical protein n=1 Tax=Gynuella sp. TaxID=2969146 RepID=UPI003D0C95C3
MIELIKTYWPAVLTVFNLLITWMAWSFRKSTVSPEEFKSFSDSIHGAINTLDTDVRKQINAQNSRLDEHEKRLTRFESELRHVPNHDDLKDIHSRLDNVSESLSEIKGKTQASSNQLSLIYQHLLNTSKGNPS